MVYDLLFVKYFVLNASEITTCSSFWKMQPIYFINMKVMGDGGCKIKATCIFNENTHFPQMYYILIKMSFHFILFCFIPF